MSSHAPTSDLSRGARRAIGARAPERRRRDGWAARGLATAALALGAACQATPTEPPPAPDDVVIATHSLTWGPVTVPPRSESTQCIWRRLSNDAAIKVRQVHNRLSSSSHHLIVYKDDMDATEQLTPVPCQPFTGALNTSGKIFPMVITQKHDDELKLPSGVAYTLAPHQMVKLEMHYLNSSDAPIEATATVEFGAADPAAIRDEANILFIGSPDIAIAPHSRGQVHQFFNPYRAGLDLDGAKFFAITGHTHKLGLDVEISAGPDPVFAQPGTLRSIYAPDPFLWSEPATATFSPEFEVPAGEGFDFSCTYFNDSGATVRFGESANNEMCFFWAYYYPSSGAHVCGHTVYHGVNIDLCCPEAGDELCNLLSGQ